jgi:hypothetical protein
MDFTERQLAVILQACVDFAGQLIGREGGFLPFGARVKPGGEIEFLQLAMNDSESLGDLYDRTGRTLAGEARHNEIVAAALVANVGLPGHDACENGHFHNAAVVQIEAPNFCRSIIAPYRAGASRDGTQRAVEFAKMVPEAGERIVFVD